MKTYKHKTLGWLAKEYISEHYKEGFYNIIKDPIKDTSQISVTYQDKKEVLLMYKELIENSLEREEVVIEKDWISDLYNFLVNNEGLWERDGLFREYVEKHIPKQKKFTRDDVANRKYGQDKLELQNMTLTDMICAFLRDHNILS